MDHFKRFMPLPLKDVRVHDGFWSEYAKLVREVVIPYQWDALNDRITDAEPSYAVRNFRIAAGEEEGAFEGMVFQDSDVAKWLEAVGYSLQTSPDPELEKIADEVIELIGRAQQPDGYLNTYFIINGLEKRWTNLHECHELYCAGHLMEAAVAYFQATGKRKLLDIVCRYADHIDSVFGREEGKLRGYDGHQEIELALVKLYEATGEERYLRLSQYFIDERGNEPYFFDAEWEKRGGVSHWFKRVVEPPSRSKTYNQTHLPVRRQSEAVGHAVRAVYMYTGMADIAARTGDKELLEACRRLWDNMTSRQLYITGGIGSTAHGEAFTFDYDLPNDSIYSETCASIGLVFFAWRMLQMEARSCYADVMEKALYNTIAGSMSKDGKHYFYVNPLEVWPSASEKSPVKQHVKPVRQKWFGCACCPPNIARLLLSLGQYIYTVGEDTVYTHLYIGGEAVVPIGAGKVKLTQKTDYPWDGTITMEISLQDAKEFAIGLRIPDWCQKAHLKVNNQTVDVYSSIKEGYAIFRREWNDGDRIELMLDMPVELMQSHPRVRANAGKVAIQRGPLVYCLEEADNGDNLSAILLPLDGSLSAEQDESQLGRMILIRGEALRTDETVWSEELYRPLKTMEAKISFKAIPYYLWGNRKPGEMLVWIRVKE